MDPFLVKSVMGLLCGITQAVIRSSLQPWHMRKRANARTQQACAEERLQTAMQGASCPHHGIIKPGGGFEMGQDFVLFTQQCAKTWLVDDEHRGSYMIDSLTNSNQYIRDDHKPVGESVFTKKEDFMNRGNIRNHQLSLV